MKKTRLTALFMALLLCGANVMACGSGEGAGVQDTTAAGTELGGYYRIYRADSGYPR